MLNTIGVLLMIPMLLSGCFSSRELNESGLVSGAAFDKDGDKYQMTVQILQPLKLTPAARGHSEQATYITQETGDNIFQIIRRFPRHTARKLFWSHCHVFIIGHDLAQQDGVTEVLDWFYRNQELRPLSFVVLAKGKARDVHPQRSLLNPVSAYDMADTIETMNDTSTAPIVRLKDFMRNSANPVETAYMPEIERAQVIGTGVFLHNRVVGELNVDESRGLLTLINQIHSGQVNVPSLTNPDKSMSVEIIRAHEKTRVKFVHQQPEVFYDVDYVVDLAEDPSRYPHDTKTIQQIEQRVSDRTRHDCEICIEKIKGMHADIIGAGEAIEYANSQLWKEYVRNWENRFPDIPIHVQVKTHLRHEGLTQGNW